MRRDYIAKVTRLIEEWAPEARKALVKGITLLEFQVHVEGSLELEGDWKSDSRRVLPVMVEEANDCKQTKTSTRGVRPWWRWLCGWRV